MFFETQAYKKSAACIMQAAEMSPITKLQRPHHGAKFSAKKENMY